MFKREECENSREKKFVASRLVQFFPHPPTKAIHFAQPDSSRALSGEKCSIKQPALYQQAQKQLSERLNNLTLCRRLKTRRATDRFSFSFFFLAKRRHSSSLFHGLTIVVRSTTQLFPTAKKMLIFRRRHVQLSASCTGGASRTLSSITVVYSEV